jgi:hypothetical protein
VHHGLLGIAAHLALLAVSARLLARPRWVLSVARHIIREEKDNFSLLTGILKYTD